MQKQIKFVAAIIIFFVLTSIAHADVIIDSTIVRQITNILEKPSNVFQLDLKENKIIFDRMDKQFEKYINFKKSKSIKRDERIMFKLEQKKNIPISPPGITVKGIEPIKPFYVFYVKEPQKRTFMKKIDIPSKRTLPDTSVISVGESFITKNKFCKITTNDILIAPLVISRKRHELKPDIREEDKLTIIQRVEFKRKFFGLEVINSKQIVDVHPDSREIISYKNIMWTPVNETSGESKSYISQREVIAKIDSAFTRSTDEYKVTKVKAGMYQTDKIIFPVLVVYTKPTVDRPEVIPEERVLIINLTKDLDLDKEKKVVKRPTKAK